MTKEYFKPIEFDEMKIELKSKEINKTLKQYIEKQILPQYELNDKGHNIDHINYVYKRALELISNDLDINILYVCVMFHDIACHINRDIHEILSAKIAYNDQFLNNFFTKEELEIIKEAIEDHRASLKTIPRNTYGKILSSADRKIDIKSYFIASMSFDIKNKPELTKEEIINSSFIFAQKKYGKEGYAVNKSYVEDKKYEQYLNELQYLIKNEEEYYNAAKVVYKELIKKI